MNDDQVRHMAVIAHCVYASSDLTYRCIMMMRERGLVDSVAPDSYLTFAHPPLDQGVVGPK